MEIKTEEPPKPRRRVKKARGHGGHHGGAWKVAYADFVTAMMALFLVLWLVSQADVQLKQSIAAYFRSPGVFDTMEGGILAQAKKVSNEPTSQTSKDNEQALFSVAASLQKKFETRPEFSRNKDQIKIAVTEEGLRIELIDKADRVSFPSGSAALAPEAQRILEEIAAGICSLPNLVNIGGHTDSRVFPSSKGYTNWELSADRANAARRVLESNCVKASQIRRIVGFADTEPMDASDPFSPVNRRISITVLRLAEEVDETSTAPPANEKFVAPAANSPKEKPKTVSGKSPDTPETKEANKKLLNEGSVVVGEPDKVPDRPKVN